MFFIAENCTLKGVKQQALKVLLWFINYALCSISHPCYKKTMPGKMNYKAVAGKTKYIYKMRLSENFLKSDLLVNEAGWAGIL